MSMVIKKKKPAAPAAAPAPAPAPAPVAKQSQIKPTPKPIMKKAPPPPPPAEEVYEEAAVEDNPEVGYADEAAVEEPQYEAKQTVATITKEYKDGSIDETKEVLSEDMFDGPTANIGVTVGMTKNLGDYNNIKFQVSIHMPCRPDAEDIEETYNNCREWVDEKVNAFNDEITEQLGH